MQRERGYYKPGAAPIEGAVLDPSLYPTGSTIIMRDARKYQVQADGSLRRLPTELDEKERARLERHNERLRLLAERTLADEKAALAAGKRRG